MTDQLSEQEQREMEEFHRDVREKAEFIEQVVSDLADAPEMLSMIHAYGQTIPEYRRSAMKQIARFATGFVSKRIEEYGRERQSRPGS